VNWIRFRRKLSGPQEQLVLFGELPNRKQHETATFGEFCFCYWVCVKCCVTVFCAVGCFEIFCAVGCFEVFCAVGCFEIFFAVGCFEIICKTRFDL
jgi:hypothetical protein